MSRALFIAGCVFVALALLFSIYQDLRNTQQGGAVDLRNRITGIRLLTHGIDPYHFIWHAGDPPEYCDLRNNPHLGVSKTTVTPTLLMIYLPVSGLPYRTIQFLWLFAQWMFLLGTAWLWLRACTNSLQRWAIILFTTGFTYTQSWRWEAERGQSYMLLSFLFASWMVLALNSNRKSDFAAGLIAGILVALRPPFVLLLPFIAIHRRSQWLGAATGLLLGIGLPLLLAPSSWFQYSSTMQIHADQYRTGFNPTKGPQAFPQVIEGTPVATLGHLYPFGYGDISVQTLLHRFGFSSVPPQLALFIVVALFCLWLSTSKSEPIPILLPGLAAWFLLADLVLPAIRYSYYDILILNLVFASIAISAKFPWRISPCFLALPIGCAAYSLSPVPTPLYYLPAVFFLVGAIACVCFTQRRSLDVPL